MVDVAVMIWKTLNRRKAWWRHYILCLIISVAWYAKPAFQRGILEALVYVARRKAYDAILRGELAKCDSEVYRRTSA
jgi:hypothetical protein